MFSPKNPFLSSLAPLVEGVRKDRQSVSRDNALWQTQERIGKAIESSLDAYCDMRDRLVEKLFHDVYGSPLLQSLVGLKSSDATPRPRPGVDAVYRAFVAQRIEELTRKIAEGDPREAAVRALLYIRMPEGVADECGFRLLERMREEVGTGLSLAAFKTLVRDQFFTLLLDERRAVEAIPTMLDADPEQASRMASVLRKLVEVVGVESKSGKARLAEIEAIFEARKKVRAPKNGGPREGHPETVRSVRSPASKSGPHSRNLS
jgi:hypothetical protein